MIRLALASLLSLAACGATGASNDASEGAVAASNASAPANLAATGPEANAIQPADDQSAKPVEDARTASATPAGLTRDFLVGHWGNPDSGSCGGGGGSVQLLSDGSYSTSEAGGRWRLEGATLHMTNWGGAPAQLELRANGDLGVTWDYGSEVWRRCPS